MKREDEIRAQERRRAVKIIDRFWQIEKAIDWFWWNNLRSAILRGAPERKGKHAEKRI